jgi:hypothetical protein
MNMGPNLTEIRRKPVLTLDTDLEERLKSRRPGRTPTHLADLDIGDFQSIPPSTTRQEISAPVSVGKFHFQKWIHRTNNSDLALVTLQNDSNPKILKIVIP